MMNCWDEKILDAHDGTEGNDKSICDSEDEIIMFIFRLD